MSRRPPSNALLNRQVFFVIGAILFVIWIASYGRLVNIINEKDSTDDVEDPYYNTEADISDYEKKPAPKAGLPRGNPPKPKPKPLPKPPVHSKKPGPTPKPSNVSRPAPVKPVSRDPPPVEPVKAPVANEGDAESALYSPSDPRYINPLLKHDGECTSQPLPFSNFTVHHTNTDECLKFAAQTVAPSCETNSGVIFHTQWIIHLQTANRLENVAEKANIVFKAFLVTQQPSQLLYVWTDDPVKALELCPGLEKFPDRVFFKKWNPAEQAKDTPVEQMSSQNLNRNDYKNWKGGDLLRIVVLYKYGGLYFDLDSLLLRDLTPLFNQDFVYQWPCIEQDATNGAFMFSQRPGGHMITKFAEALVQLQSSYSDLGWGSELYRWARNHGASFQIFPSCFFDPLWPREITYCDKGEGTLGKWMFDDFWKKDLPGVKKLYDFFPGTFAIHWHNRYNNPIYPTAPIGLAKAHFDKEFDKLLSQQQGSSSKPQSITTEKPAADGTRAETRTETEPDYKAWTQDHL